MAKFAPTVARIDEPVFLVLAWDGPGSATPRDEHLGGHLEYIEKHYERYLACGPLREPGGTDLVGSFFLVAAKDETDARDFLAGDPYLNSGMYTTVTVHEATAAGGRWMGGVIWESAEAIRANA